MLAVLFRVPDVPDLILSPEPDILIDHLRGFLYYSQVNPMTTPHNMAQQFPTAPQVFIYNRLKILLCIIFEQKLKVINNGKLSTS
jgi:hypothetical protein